MPCWGQSLVRACATLALVLSTALAAGGAAAAPVEQAEHASELYDALAASLQPGTNRAAPRLQRATIDATGDTTVVFAIRASNDDAEAVRAGALADTLTVLRTVYQSPDANRVSMLTVLGTFPFKGTKGKSVRESPVLRAVLSAERAALLELDALTTSDLPTALDVWWLQGAFANAEGAAPRELEPEHPQGAAEQATQLAQMRSRLEVARAHLEEAIAALTLGEVPVLRSQFKQFFDSWEDLDEPIRQMYPTQYEALDLDLDRAEIALLHTRPEDLDAAGRALENLRLDLAEISRDLQAQQAVGASAWGVRVHS
ncbi:MAG: hypothetical protein M3336_17105 [Chloroflexota bacterium]|nr:hypothetical protein [Chloroflexota bacterium]